MNRDLKDGEEPTTEGLQLNILDKSYNERQGLRAFGVFWELTGGL